MESVKMLPSTIENCGSQLDATDRLILAKLTRDGRVSDVALADQVGLSPSACARRVARLERQGIIKGYSVSLDLQQFGYRTLVMVRIVLERQSDEAFKSFEAAIARCPYVLSCHLMSGSDDYLLHVVGRDVEDYEKIYKTYLTKLPGVMRIQSSFVMRQIVDRKIPTTVVRS